MTRLYFGGKILTFFVGIVVLFLTSAWESSAQNDALTTLSGRVINEAGHPIPGLTIALVPVQDGRGAWFPIEVEERRWPDDPMAFQAETDSEGRFVITDTIASPVLLGLFPYYEPEAQILKIQIGDMFLYPPGEPWGRGTVFAVEPGEYIKNVELTVRRFLQFRGKVLKMDGSPLANAQRIKFRVKQLGLGQKEENSGSMSWGIETDDEGNFVQYMTRYMSGPAFYLMSVVYQEHQVQLDPIVVKPEYLFHEAVFTFEAPLLPDVPENAPRHFHAGVSVRFGGGIDAKGVWVVNPENGHAYKKISFNGVEDAMAQATKENAYLVAINDEAEQNWLERAFVLHRILIGLNDVEEEGQWQWHSGEPVTYTNWARYEPQDTDKGDEDYVILFANQWVDIDPGDMRWRFINSALLEKEGASLKK